MARKTSGQIAEKIAEEEDTEPDDLDMVLHNHIPTDAIRTLMDHQSDSWSLQFETPNHVIEVRGDDTVFIYGEKKPTPA